MNSPPGTLEKEDVAMTGKDGFFTKQDIPPVLESSKYWLLNVLRDDLTWLCPVDKEGNV
jgi:AP-3 complex subunit mu